MLFLFFQNVSFFGLKHCISWEAYIIWSWILVHMCKMMISHDVSFQFFKILIVQVVGGVKGQKMFKKFCPSYLVSQELYIVWLWFLVHICKMISPALFFHFCKILIFFVFRRVKLQKLTQNYQFQSVTFFISGTVGHIIKILGTQV